MVPVFMQDDWDSDSSEEDKKSDGEDENENNDFLKGSKMVEDGSD